MQVYNYISYDSNCVTMVYASMNSRYSKYIQIVKYQSMGYE